MLLGLFCMLRQMRTVAPLRGGGGTALAIAFVSGAKNLVGAPYRLGKAGRLRSAKVSHKR